MIVNPRRRDIGVTKPLLHLGDVGLVVEGIRGGRRAQRVCANVEAEQGGVAAHQAIHAVRRDRAFLAAGAVVADRPEQRAAVVEAVAGRVEIVADEAVRPWMQRQITGLAAFAGHVQMRNAFAGVAEVLHLQLAQFLAPQRVEQQS